MLRSSRHKVSLLSLFSLSGVFLLLTVVFLCDRQIENAAAGSHSENPLDLPERKVALVLGCAETLANGQTNRYFTARINAAALLYFSGKCRFFLVSGDNSRKDYDEPACMTESLVKRGVPESVIYQDYAGFRTLDSIIRASQIFGQEELIVVSQRFHNERAIYIASHHGVTVHGLDAEDVGPRSGVKTQLREKLARVKTIMDIHLLETGPRFLGDRIDIGNLPEDKIKNHENE